MTTITFEYTKSDIDTSKRVFEVLSPASDKYFGVDITELDQEAQGVVMDKFHSAHIKYMQEVKEIMQGADITNNFRHFFANKMSNIT
jgi:enolase